MATTKRAAKGGELGANGEFYEGGRFINTVAENPKRHGSAPKRARKVNVEPYAWVTLEPGDDRRPIFRIVGTGAEYIDRYDWEKGIRPYAPAFRDGVAFCGETIEAVSALCDRFNAGERWM